ncbi:hypothetical protein PAHAL_8G105900 [Panicum hallii]|uniref:DUF6598 domain-containing protein n=1 Tax=Panicum hallii TaxID=206008 RepID=A0A2S3IE07_9POAL|nr:uncharacterized protein LOC112903624 [Panicum hallii]PAN42332.1 hypothetical protein PAHAL_8G105900 [Panicum hallii]
MSGRRRPQQQPPPRPRPQPLDFDPPGRVLFRVTFNVAGATATGFNHFIEQVQRRIFDLIERPRYYGRGTMVLPCPQAQQPTWFVIVLESRDREMRYSVPFFIEAESIYLHGYQNQAGYLFEFDVDPTQDNQPASGSYLGRNASTPLPFSCNYGPLVRATKRKGPNKTVLDPGLTLLEDEPGTPMPDFGRHRLMDAVMELAQGDNSGSLHRTAQNLLLVVIRFCESIRFRSVQREMASLWEPTTSAAASLSSCGVGQIKNWNSIATNLQDSARHPVAWPAELVKAGVRSAAEAQEILVVIKFIGYPNEPGNPTPEWGNPPPDNPYRRHGGGPGPGPGGAAGGVLAAEVPRWFLVPEEPVMQILGVDIPRQRGAGRLEGVYGSITVTDGFGTQTIYRRNWDYYQRNSGDSEMSLELEALNRAISAYDSVDVDVDLSSASPAAPLTTGNFSWSVYNCRANRYDHVLRRTIGRAVLEYIVYSKAVQVAVSVTVDGGDDVAHAWFTTMNTMVGVLQPGPRRYMTRAGGGRLLRGDYVVAAPLSARLEVVVTVEHKGSRQLVGRTFELQPTGDGGRSTRTETVRQGTSVKVDFAWNLLRMGLPSPTSSAGRNSHDELRRR